ncbi:patatin-like phospholipase family protein [Marinobacter sp. R17]|uniref:patatin-like phospholipase family protein n=1 Tax=Marinobacter TaxID=2742 RepID=UPI000F4D1070|nr:MULTISPECIES: patatin-like phospholipase family protein [Marinobacter]ROU02274.1 patatin-like phospholipase family protein [Marinobacter sp. R17]
MQTGVVLTGGGARAAYQVGVLKAISEMYPDWAHPFRVITGTSAGAINAVAIASGGGVFRHNIARLEGIWSELTIDQIYKSHSYDILRNVSDVARRLITDSTGEKPMSLLNNSPLRALLEKEVDFGALKTAIDEDRLSAVGINACGYTTGQNVCFFQAGKDKANWTTGQRAGARTNLTLDHIMASSAIPTVFRPVKINREYFGDGVTRQMAHISPALRLGAERVIVVGVSANHVCFPGRPKQPPMPGFSQVLAHVFNGMFLDTLDYDIDRLRLINQLLELVPKKKLEESGLDLRPVHLLEISPSEDIGEIATRHLDNMPLVLRKLAGASSEAYTPGSSLASYLMFDHRFCRELISLGYKDAQTQARQIEQFFREA